MLRSITLSLSFLLFAACGGADKSTTTAPPSNEQTAETPTEPSAPAPCETPAEGPMTPDQCTCQGGTVHGDPGDGSAHCEAPERELGKVATGIEGGVCCAPAEAPAPATP